MPSYVNCCMYNCCYLYPSTVKPLTWFPDHTVRGQCLVREKLVNLVNRMPFANAKHFFHIQLQLYMQLVRQYVTLQLVRISQFANILLHQKFPNTVCPFNKTSFGFKASIAFSYHYVYTYTVQITGLTYINSHNPVST